MRVAPKVLIAVIVLLLGFLVGQWFFFKARFESALPGLEAQAEAAGYVIDYSERTIGGFPFRLEAHYADVRLARTGPLLSFGLEAKKAVLIRQLLRTDLSLLYFDSPTFAASAAAPMPGDGSGEVTLAFAAPALQTSWRAEGENLARMSAVVDQPEGSAGFFGVGPFAAQQLQFHLYWPVQGRRAPDGQIVPRLTINSQVTRLTLKDRDTAPLPETIGSAQIGLTVKSASQIPLTPQGLAQWHTDKGMITLTQLDARWGDITVGETQGTLRLTQDLRLRGQVTPQVTGLAALTYAIDKTAILPPDREELALITLRLMRAGKGAEDTVPIMLDFAEDGTIRLGPAPLARLGPVIPANEEDR